MTDDENRTRVVAPNSILRAGVVTALDDDDDPMAVMGSTERAQVMEALALAKAPLDFDLTGAGNEAPEQAHPTLDFDLTGGDDTADAVADGALDLDLSSGETSIPVVAAAAVSAAVTRPPTAVKAPPMVVEIPAAGSGVGKWIAIVLAIAAAVLATVYLRK